MTTGEIVSDSKCYQESYGNWSGNPDGRPANHSLCCKSVYAKGKIISHQCRKARGFGPDRAYCKQHDPLAIEARRKITAEKWDAKFADERPKLHAAEFLNALRDIAAGHNDAKGLAQQVLAEFDKK
jgi:hypothetical protein